MNRTRSHLSNRPAGRRRVLTLAAATVIPCAGLLACGGASESDDTRSEIVELLQSENLITRDHAECMADMMIAAGFDLDDFAAGNAFRDSAGADESLRFADTMIEAAAECLS